MTRKRGTLSKRAIAARKNGRLGGLATARNHDKEFLVARASRAGQANLERYGKAFFAHIATLRRSKPGWPKGRPRKPAPVTEQIIPDNQVALPPSAAMMASAFVQVQAN